VTKESIGENCGFDVHPLRGRVLAEVHARPFTPIEGLKRILHFAFMTDHDAAERARVALAAFCLERAVAAPLPDAKQHRVMLSPAILRWEHHGEFTTYTWEFPQENSGDAKEIGAFRPPAYDLARVMRMLPQPGPLLVAVDLQILPEQQAGDNWRSLFSPSELVESEVMAGGAVVATDFYADAFGFVRLLVLNRTLTPIEMGALVQRLLEIETYRTLALLGLPMAQMLGPEIRRIETELPVLVQRFRESEGFLASRELLDRLTALAADLEASASKSLYRFGATKAYYELMTLRLAAIGECAAPNLSTFAAFLTRRVTPAIRTCASIEARQDNLSRKLSRAAQLLRTRVDIELESQNRDLLSNMNERSQLQLQLQTAVKGISIAAMTYYMAAIMHLLFEGVHEEFPLLNATLATAIAVPLSLGFILWMMRRHRKAQLPDPKSFHEH
jgi:uncharacterized membrane-anchored protein